MAKPTNPLNVFTNTPHELLAEASRLANGNRQCQQAISGVEETFCLLTPALVQIQKQNINKIEINPIQGLLNPLVAEIKQITPEAAQLDSEKRLTFVQQIVALANQIATKILGTKNYDAQFFREMNQGLIPIALDIQSSLDKILRPPSVVPCPAAAAYEEMAAQPTPEKQEETIAAVPVVTEPLPAPQEEAPSQEPELLPIAGCSWEKDAKLKTALQTTWNKAFTQATELPESRSRNVLLKELTRVKEALNGTYKPYVSSEVQRMTLEELQYKMPEAQQAALRPLLTELIAQLEAAMESALNTPQADQALSFTALCIERMSHLVEEFSRYTPKPTVRQTVADTIGLAAMAHLVSTKKENEPISEEVLAERGILVSRQLQMANEVRGMGPLFSSLKASDAIALQLRAVAAELNAPKTVAEKPLAVEEGPGFLASVLADLAVIGNFFSWLGSLIASCFSSSSEEE